MKCLFDYLLDIWPVSSLPQRLVILIRKRAPARAVEPLERGRGVCWGQFTRLHSLLNDLIVSSPAGKTLADEFGRLASLIRNALKSPGVDQHERVCHLNLEL